MQISVSRHMQLNMDFLHFRKDNAIKLKSTVFLPLLDCVKSCLNVISVYISLYYKCFKEFKQFLSK